jgi:hypothetical protein
MVTNEPTNQQTKLTAKYSTKKPTKPNQTKSKKQATNKRLRII